MSERIRGGYDDALYKSTFTLLYFTLWNICGSCYRTPRSVVRLLFLSRAKVCLLSVIQRPRGKAGSVSQCKN